MSLEAAVLTPRTIERLLRSRVDQIIKGASPADLPIERYPKIDVVVNSKVAKALGVPIDPRSRPVLALLNHYRSESTWSGENGAEAISKTLEPRWPAFAVVL